MYVYEQHLLTVPLRLHYCTIPTPVPLYYLANLHLHHELPFLQKNIQ